MKIHPILKTLMRKKLALFLLSLQIAITIAVFSNTLLAINEQYKYLSTPSNLPNSDILFIYPQNFSDEFNIEATMNKDLQVMNDDPDIIAATPAQNIPAGGRNEFVYTGPNEDTAERHRAIIFDTNEKGPEILNLILISGRFFTANEVDYYNKDEKIMMPSVVVISESLSKQLYPGSSALGKSIWLGLNSPPVQVIGIYKDFLGGHVRFNRTKYQTLIRPQVYWEKRYDPNYLIRTKPGKAHEVKNRLLDKLLEVEDRYIHDINSLDEAIEESVSGIKLTSILFSIFSLIICVVVISGISGLATHAVTERNREIGVRRALGATKKQVISLLIIEKLIVAAIAVVLGVMIGIGLNILAVKNYLMSSMLGFYELLLCSLFMIGLVALATYFPARKAALIDPAIVTKTG